MWFLQLQASLDNLHNLNDFASSANALKEFKNCGFGDEVNVLTLQGCSWCRGPGSTPRAIVKLRSLIQHLSSLSPFKPFLLNANPNLVPMST